MPFTPQQVAQLNDKLDRSKVAQRKQAGQTLSYIEGWWAMAEANRIFGHHGWDYEIMLLERVVEQQRDDHKFEVAYIARVKVDVTVEGGYVSREDVGYGSGISKQLGDAYEGAVKEAVTDAMKRALRGFGWPFGLALYDKSQANVGEAEHGADAEADQKFKAQLEADAEEMRKWTQILTDGNPDRQAIADARGWMSAKVNGTERWRLMNKAAPQDFKAFSEAMNKHKEKAV
ncbi:MAG: hypothetical protein GVY22_09265 [Gammaproteobacteria bacterium]|jgi:DNA recombination protein Rad52|nr:hypothetical protein [Gammaproteobacteria bacterium]